MDYYEKTNKAVESDVMSITDQWYSCDFIHGKRTSQQVFDQEATKYITTRIGQILKYVE
jgi:hypothetical protein